MGCVFINNPLKVMTVAWLCWSRALGCLFEAVIDVCGCLTCVAGVESLALLANNSNTWLIICLGPAVVS